MFVCNTVPRMFKEGPTTAHIIPRSIGGYKANCRLVVGPAGSQTCVWYQNNRIIEYMHFETAVRLIFTRFFSKRIGNQLVTRSPTQTLRVLLKTVLFTQGLRLG